MYFQQKLALDQRAISKDEIVLSTFVHGKRVYLSLPDKDEVARFILSGKDGAEFCNELLYTDCYAFCDIDSPQNLTEIGLTEEQFIENFNNILIDCYAEHLELQLRPSDILWACSSS